MASSTDQNATPNGATHSGDDAATRERLNGALAVLNDAVLASEERGTARGSRPRKRSHEETGEPLAEAVHRHEEREKRQCVDQAAGDGLPPVDELGGVREVAAQVVALTQMSERLSGEVATLKEISSMRGEQIGQVVENAGVLGRVESEVKTLQKQYDECSRRDLAVIQDAMQRLSDCMGKIDQLQRAGNVTSHELQGFRQDYNCQIDAMLAKLETLSSTSSQRTALNIDAVTADEIHQLRDELAICKDELTEMEPRRAAVENEFFQRMERFSNQLDHVRLQMSKMEQDLLQENAVCRRSLENLLSRQMTQFRHSQSAENKRLRDEMDELRSDMCELLKEMHLLKERTKYLGREPRRGGSGPQASMPGLTFPRYSSSELRQANSSPSNLYTSACSSYLCTRPTQRVPLHGDEQLYCQHHHCPAGIPHGQPITAIASREPSPPRLTESALLQASQANAPRLSVPVAGHHDIPRFCPSPHYSSRSSSVSGRISATRDERAQPDEHVGDEELERRLLEKHRLFWISEGAGSVSQASLEPPRAKFPDEDE